MAMMMKTVYFVECARYVVKAYQLIVSFSCGQLYIVGNVDKMNLHEELLTFQEYKYSYYRVDSTFFFNILHFLCKLYN